MAGWQWRGGGGGGGRHATGCSPGEDPTPGSPLELSRTKATSQPRTGLMRQWAHGRPSGAAAVRASGSHIRHAIRSSCLRHAGEAPLSSLWGASRARLMARAWLLLQQLHVNWEHTGMSPRLGGPCGRSSCSRPCSSAEGGAEGGPAAGAARADGSPCTRSRALHGAVTAAGPGAHLRLAGMVCSLLCSCCLGERMQEQNQRTPARATHGHRGALASPSCYQSTCAVLWHADPWPAPGWWALTSFFESSLAERSRETVAREKARVHCIVRHAAATAASLQIASTSIRAPHAQHGVQQRQHQREGCH